MPLRFDDRLVRSSLLSYRHSAGRYSRHIHIHVISISTSYPRHSALAPFAHIINRALDAAGTPCVLEPAGLDRGYGRRPDDIKIFPFLQGKSLMWNATCSDTFAPLLITASSAFPGSAANAAEDSKRRNYASQASGYHFVPFSVGTLKLIDFFIYCVAFCL